MPSEVTIRNRWNLMLVVFIGFFPLLIAVAPVGSGLVRAGWVVLWLAVASAVVLRVARISVTANRFGLTVRNLARNYDIPWSDVTAMEVEKSDNVTSAVTTIVIHRDDGSKVIARAASAYSRSTVERWLEELTAFR